MNLLPGDLGYIQHRLRMILGTTDVATIHHDAAMALVVLEHLDGDPEARVAALNEAWQGKRVRTEDHTLPPSGNLSDRLEIGNPFGGEGVAVAFYERGGRVWLQSDWGYEWVIEPTTTITELPERSQVSTDEEADGTDAEVAGGQPGQAESPDPTCQCGHPRSEHFYASPEHPTVCGHPSTKLDSCACMKFVPQPTEGDDG